MAESVQIGKYFIGPGHPAFIIAEAGINHDGDVERAKKLIDAAAEARADAVKFQTFKAESHITPNAPRSSYIVEGSYEGESFLDLARRLELTYDDFAMLKEYATQRGLIFLSTPFEEESVDFLVELGVKALKVASGNLTHLPLLRHIASKNLPVIMSTGMASLGEIEEAIETIYGTGNEQLILMHCVSWYPAALADVSLRVMETLRQAFQVPTGYSDHTLGIAISIAARAMGACILEKHFTLDKNAFGPDHAASIEPEDLTQLVKSVREVELSLGYPVKRIGEVEMGQRDVHRRSIVAAVPIAAGATIELAMLAVKRPGNGLPSRYLDWIIGKKASRDIQAEELVGIDCVTIQ